MSKQRPIKPALTPRHTDKGTGGRNGARDHHDRTHTQNIVKPDLIPNGDNKGIVWGPFWPITCRDVYDPPISEKLPKSIPISVLVVKWPDGHYWSSSICYN